MSDPFVHLHVASGYSLRHGASHPSALVERAARDITQADLAERAGVPQVAISRLERGARGLRPDRLARIARALDLDPAEVFPFVLDEDPALTAPRADVA